MMRTWKAVTLAVLLAGCVTKAGTIDPQFRLGESDISIVIGRMEAVRALDSRSDDLNKILKGTMVLTVVHEALDKTYEIKTADSDFGSDFYVALPPGRYRITKWSNSALESRLRGWFDVPPRRVVYIGTLRWSDRGPDFLSRRGRWTLHDDTEEVSSRFRGRFPAVDERITKSFIFSNPERGVSASP